MSVTEANKSGLNWYQINKIEKIISDTEAVKLWVDLLWEHPCTVQVRFNGVRNKFKSVNDAFAKHLGRDPDDLVDADLYDLIAPMSVQHVEELLNTPKNDSGVDYQKVGYSRPDGTIAWILWKVHVYRDMWTLAGGVPCDENGNELV